MKKMERSIVDFIVCYYKKNQFYPNYDEIADGVGRAKATVYTHIKKMEREGIIVRKSDYSSQYRLLNMDYILKGKHCEVIGNIFDNPELIN